MTTAAKYYKRKSKAELLRFLVRLYNPAHPRPNETLAIPSRDAGRSIKAHLYEGASALSPSSSSTSSPSSKTTTATTTTTTHESSSPKEPSPKEPSPQEPSPVLINFCGSGFTLRNFGSDDEFCRYMAAEAGYVVIDVNYRLAPEHPFNGALNDAEDVIQWVRSQPQRFDQSRISLSGFSAGGNIALAITSSSPLFQNKNPKEHFFRAVLSFYGPVDMTVPTPEKRPADDSNGIIRWIFPKVSHFCHKCLNPSIVQTDDPRLSPMFADPTQFPDNVLVITAAQDPFAVEGERLAEKIRSIEGHHVVCKRMEGCPHGWDKEAKAGTSWGDAKKESYDLAVEMLRL